MPPSEEPIKTEEKEAVIDQIGELNENVKRQMSARHILKTGIIYGIGFVIGSAIIATIVIGLLSPFFESIPWVRNTFEKGSSFVR